MIARVNIISRKTNIASVNGVGGSGEHSEPLSGILGGRPPPKKIFEAVKNI